MTNLLICFLLLPLVVAGYAYVGYPLALRIWAGFRPPLRPLPAPLEWPAVSITVPAYNEEGSIRTTLERLLATDYPPDRRQILVVSDASTDRTDEIVAEYADRGVGLLRMPCRLGKTAAENAARRHLTGEIVINTDASVRIHPEAVKSLVVWLQDPRIGVASGRDVSVGRGEGEPNVAESGYVGYEMMVRRLETRVRGIVGASGCLYAIRRELHDRELPENLSRDFAAVLVAWECGYRAVSVEDALCHVALSRSLRREYSRKVRTAARGLQTLLYKWYLLNPFRYGTTAWILFSHKLCRWLVPMAAALALIALAILAWTHVWARWLILPLLALAGLAAIGWNWPEQRQAPSWIAIPAYLVVGNLAGVHSWLKVLLGERKPTWEPTRRQAAKSL